jgi:Nif-specific regulatory protein
VTVEFAPASLAPTSLQALAAAATAIGSSLDLEAVLQTIARLSCSVAHAEAGTLFTVDPQLKRIKAEAAIGPRKDVLLGRDFDSAGSIAGQVARIRSAIHVLDARRHPKFSREVDGIGIGPTQGLIAVPMMHRGEVIGVIEVANRRDGRPFGPHDVEILGVFATLAAGAVRNARAHAELQRRYADLRESVVQRPTIVGDSPAMRDVLQLCDKVAPSNASVLILGETGTGKELIARHIHNASRRRNEPFVAINCAALPESLLESELFGHEKGAFTSAQGRRRGRFELADKGTLFLDEIGEMNRPIQAKLLRVLQEKEFVRVGGTETVRCDVRIIAATNRNLKHMMSDGLFRDDLYYRLSVFPIHVRPLRERRDDIPTLVVHFAAAAARDLGMRNLQVAQGAMKMLVAYDWRGNIRELQNVMDRAVLMSNGQTLLPEHLPEDIQAAAAVKAPASAEPPSKLHAQERALIEEALVQHDWNQSQAARALGITRYNLRLRMRKHNLQRPPSAEA